MKVKLLEVERPAPSSGLTSDDIKETIRQLRVSATRFPELEFLILDVPEEYDPELSVLTPGKIIELGPRVTRADKEKALRAIQTIFNEDSSRLIGRLKRKEIGVDEWVALARKEISHGHTSAYSAGRSGAWGDITFRQWGRLGSKIKRQFEYLKGFANEIRSKGIDAFSAEQLELRMSLYGDNMMESLRAGEVEDRGLDADVFPAMPGDGTTRCLVRCKCRWTIRPNGRDKWLVSWRLGKAEHCRTCLDRSDDWRDLQVQDGRIISEIQPHFHNHQK